MPQVMTRVQIQDFGTATFLTDGGAYISCGDDGGIGTASMSNPPGPHELCAVNGNVVTYAPTDGKIYNFPFVKSVPNYVGWSGIFLGVL